MPAVPFDQVPLQSIYALPATARMDAPLMREIMTPPVFVFQCLITEHIRRLLTPAVVFDQVPLQNVYTRVTRPPPLAWTGT